MTNRWCGCMVRSRLRLFLQKLEYMGLYKNTIVTILSDHGVGIGYQGIVGKPIEAQYPQLMDLVMMVKAPDIAPAVVDSIVYNIDLFPTFFNFMGLPLPWETDGLDLTPLMTGEKESLRDYATSCWKEWNSVRTRQYQFVGTRDETQSRLFDLTQDPNCLHDLAADKPAVVKEMFDLLRRDAGGKMGPLEAAGTPEGITDMRITL